MKFLCLGHFDKDKMGTLAPGEVEALMARCMAVIGEMYATGAIRVEAGLENTTRNLVRRDGKVRATDGPFTEAKEMVGSAFIVEAADMDEAVRIASLHPTTRMDEGERLGWRLEIRPIHYLAGTYATG